MPAGGNNLIKSVVVNIALIILLHCKLMQVYKQSSQENKAKIIEGIFSYSRTVALVRDGEERGMTLERFYPAETPFGTFVSGIAGTGIIPLE